MKKHLIAAAALATLSTAAFAQNVTVYGIVDTGVFTTNNDGGLRATKVVQGTWLPSLWGFTGSEDLGGGLKAGFNLQSNLYSDTGVSSSETSVRTGALFSREATVSLSGSFGKVLLGQQIDNAFLQSVINNAVFMHTGTLAVDGLVGYSKNNGNTGVLGAFVSNAVGYESPVINGLQVKLQHGQGETAGNSSQNRYQSAVATYSNAGLALSAGTAKYNQANSTTDDLKKHLLSAKYTVGNLVVATQYHKYELGTTVDTKAYEVGVAYNITPKTLLAVNYESFDDKIAGDKPKITSLKAKYALSKRTSVWGIAQRFNGAASNKMTQGYTAAMGDGTSATAFMSGITHTF